MSHLCVIHLVCDLRVNLPSRFLSIPLDRTCFLVSRINNESTIFARVYARVYRVCTCVYSPNACLPNYSSSFNETDALPARTVFVLDRLTEQVFVDSSSLSHVVLSTILCHRPFNPNTPKYPLSLILSSRRSLFQIISTLLLFTSSPDTCSSSSKYLDLSTNVFPDERRIPNT